jgi:hypothetical protein
MRGTGIDSDVEIYATKQSKISLCYPQIRTEGILAAKRKKNRFTKQEGKEEKEK